MPNLEINGRMHIPADQAARQAGLSRGYVCQLARQGVLAGRIAAGSWFVDQQGLEAFIKQRTENGSTKP